MLRAAAAFAFALTLFTPAAPAHAAARDRWPETPAGTRARAWVAAFASGDSAMRAFLSKEMAPKSIAERGAPQRIERYREMRERYGRLTLGSVIKSRETEVAVRLLDSGGSSHVFIFKVEPESPHKLLSVGMRQPGHMQGLLERLHH